MVWPSITKRFRTADTNRTVEPTPPPEPGAAWIGKLAMGRYELLRYLAEGSNGEVYLARPVPQTANQYVVVKRVKPQLLQNAKFRQFFDSEVESMKRFDHPYIVRLLDATLSDPIGPCLVLEYVHGYTLEQLLLKYPRWYPERMARLIGQLCHALQAAHDAGIMHRDIKPANIMITDFNTAKESVKVMDFGFAGFTERPHIQLAELTGHGQIFCCGTPAYVSPEMLRGDTVDCRADLYSVGIMLYEMLAGRLPFDYESVEEILSAQVKLPPPPFYKLGIRDVPPAVENVVQLALAKYPAERHQSAQQLCEHFGQSLGMPELWHDTAPAGYRGHKRLTTHPPTAALTDTVTAEQTVVDPNTPNTLFETFVATLSPKMAAAKLRGFVTDVGGLVVDSDPGVIRMRVDLPEGFTEQHTTRSGLFAWLEAMRQVEPEPGQEPIEVTMQMQNIDSNRVAVGVTFKPLPKYQPKDPHQWKSRCKELCHLLRGYLMAT